jgi:hypothetical protein
MMYVYTYVMASHTTLRLEEALIRRAKAYARREGTTLTSVMERALLAYLKDDGRDANPGTIRLPTFGRGGARDGVNLDRTPALLDVMEERAPRRGRTVDSDE